MTKISDLLRTLYDADSHLGIYYYRGGSSDKTFRDEVYKTVTELRGLQKQLEAIKMLHGDMILKGVDKNG